MATNVSRSSGNTVVEVPGMDLDPEDCAGWFQVKIGEKNETIQAKSNARIARQASARATRAARMPGILPKEETKIIVRPRGGLDLARTPVVNVISAIRKAANLSPAETVLDTQCPNIQQNIMDITISTRKYEVGAYVAAPHGRVKGVVKGIPLEDSASTINENILNLRNPLARAAQRIRTSTTIIVAFEGARVPHYVYYGSGLLRCTLYRKHFDVCRRCGKVGHRTDVCPTPESKTCLGCGKEASQDHQCNPKCKLCGGPHLTGDKDCKNKFKTPYIIRRRQWNRKVFEGTQTKAGEAPAQTTENFPHLRAPRPRSRTSSRASSRGRSRSAGGKVTWAQMARLESAEMKALKEANKQQARKIAEQEDTIKRMAADMAAMKNMMMQMAGKTNKPAPAEEETKEPPTKRRSTETSRTRTPEEKQHVLEPNERTDRIEEGCRQMESRINATLATNGGEHKRGVCTFVRRGITALTHDYKGDPNIEILKTEIIIGKESVYLVNVNNSPRYGKQRFKHLLHSNTRLADNRTLPKGRNLIQDATEEGLQLITDPRYPTLPARNAASRDTTPDLAFTNETFKYTNWDAFRHLNPTGDIKNIEEWTSDLQRAVAQASRTIETTDDTDGTMDSRLAHLIEAKQSIQKIAELNRKIESHCKKLSAQQWEDICSSADGQMHNGATDYGELLRIYRLDRQELPAPHPNLTRKEAVTYRKLQMELMLTPTIGKHIMPELYRDDKCKLCKTAKATLHHIAWDCTKRPTEAYQETSLPPEFNKAVMAEDYNQQLQAIQQIQALLKRQAHNGLPCGRKRIT
ncbi:hypothetical protein HPB47_018641 [Ixodes persulcatus]|uniref:Uncharacterized protein n=1 Tax=Ixodes persulcatus TaxID=34615 RepID=A0AC60QMH5_IXOPE|nr:hypothetical protein HPB47_018641 [Ixodes persulcatus]